MGLKDGVTLIFVVGLLYVKKWYKETPLLYKMEAIASHPKHIRIIEAQYESLLDEISSLRDIVKTHHLDCLSDILTRKYQEFFKLVRRLGKAYQHQRVLRSELEDAQRRYPPPGPSSSHH